MLSRAASVAWERYILRKQPDKLRRWAECSDGTELPERWRVGIRRQVSEIGGSSSLTRPWCGLVGARHAVPLRCFKIGRNRKSVIVVILNGMKWSESKTPVGESLFIFNVLREIPYMGLRGRFRAELHFPESCFFHHAIKGGIFTERMFRMRA